MRMHVVSALLAAILTVTFPQVVPAADPVLQEGDLLAICGDSITEQKDYSVNVATYLLACRPQPEVRVAQFGWGGDSMGWFFGRGAADSILAFQPTVATTFYGMNDGGYKPLEQKTVDDYRNGMNRLVQRFKQAGVRHLVIGSPGCVDSDTYGRRGRRNSANTDASPADTYNKTLAALRDAAREVAEANGCSFANVHDVMVDAMAKAKAKYGPQYHVAGGDGVHPSRNGGLVIAYAFLKALGVDGDIGTITLDAGGGSQTATEGHTITVNGSFTTAGGSVSIVSERYPFCFEGNPSDPNATTGIIEFLPFNEDLNRFRLIVTGLNGSRAKVTWGDASKEFSTDQLTAGINLATKFAGQNPFSAPFKAVMDAVRKQQEYETTVYKDIMPSTPVIKEALAAEGENPETAEKVVRGLVKRDAKFATASRATVKPVQHTIVIEALD